MGLSNHEDKSTKSLLRNSYSHYLIYVVIILDCSKLSDSTAGERLESESERARGNYFNQFCRKISIRTLDRFFNNQSSVSVCQFFDKFRSLLSINPFKLASLFLCRDTFD